MVSSMPSSRYSLQNKLSGIFVDPEGSMQAAKEGKQSVVLYRCNAHHPQQWPAGQVISEGTYISVVTNSYLTGCKACSTGKKLCRILPDSSSRICA